MRPVSIRPQVEALTNSDWLSPRWLAQSPARSLSAISRSAVSSSGMRNKASARHIRITPSCDDRSYCRRKASSPVLAAGALRTASTSFLAVACTSWCCASSSRARSASARTSASSSPRKSALIACPTGVRKSWVSAIQEARRSRLVTGTGHWGFACRKDPAILSKNADGPRHGLPPARAVLHCVTSYFVSYSRPTVVSVSVFSTPGRTSVL